MQSFPDLPPGFTFESELPNGFLCRTAIVMKDGLSSHCICKCIEIIRLGGQQQIDKFIGTVQNASNIHSRFILPYSEVIVHGKFIFLFRPYLNSPTLEQQLQNDTNPNQNGYYVIWKTIVHAYRKLHSGNIAPNFIRPSNIFIADDGGPIITDIYPPFFNAANPQCANSLVFLAPEFLQGEELPGKAADVWSLGLLLLFIMTGQVPWITNNLFKMMQNIMKGAAGLAIEVPDPIKPIIEASVIVDPTQRIPLSSLVKFNPVVSTISRGGTKLSKNAIAVQQSVLMKNNVVPPKISKPIVARQSLAMLPAVPSFLLNDDEKKKPQPDPFYMD